MEAEMHVGEKLVAVTLLWLLVAVPERALAHSGEEDPPRSHADPPGHKAGGHWSYAGKAQWPSTFPSCGGHLQSPIDIDTGATVFSPQLGALLLSGYDLPPGERLCLQNNGHTIVLKLPENMTLTGGGYLQPYRAVQLHLHWGSAHGVPGSEHTVDGHRFAGEIHVVHYNSQFSSFHDAVQEPGGLAVLAAFLQVGEEENEAYQHILESLKEVQEEGEKTFIAGFDVAKLLPHDLSRYFHYNGSLTTPPCYQTVNWTIFNQTIQLSQDQISMLEDTLRGDNDEPLEGNFRPQQSLQGRTVLASFLVPHSPEGAHPPGEEDPPRTLVPRGPPEGEDGPVAPTEDVGLYSTPVSGPKGGSGSASEDRPAVGGGSRSVGAGPAETQVGSSVHTGDVLAVLFGVLFAITGLAFLVYVRKHRRQNCRLDASAAKANIIYTPATTTEEQAV
ncbi:carbonic anhydrase 9 [Pogona vitticeps]